MTPATAFAKMRANRCTLEAVQEQNRLRRLRRDLLTREIDKLEREMEQSMRSKHGEAYDADPDGSEAMKVLRSEKEAAAAARHVIAEPRWWDRLASFFGRGRF